MRPVVSFVAGLVAVVAGIVSVPLLWVSMNVADEDGYVALTSRLATDSELQGAFAQYLADDYVRRGLLPAALQETAASALTSVTRATINEPEFVEAWEQTQRSFHRSAFGDDTGPLTVQAQPLAQFVVSRVGDLLPVSLEVSTDPQVPVGTAADRDRLGWVDRSHTYAMLGLMVLVASAAVCLVSARSRPVALAGLGLGALVAAGVLRVATEIVTPQAIERADGLSPFGRAFQELLFARAATTFTEWLGWIAMGGGAALVLGVLGRLVTGRPKG